MDWGELRIGIAASDETQLIASPLETLTRRAGKRFPMPTFLELVAASAAVGVVVGLPLTPEGTVGESAGAASSYGAVSSGRGTVSRPTLSAKMSRWVPRPDTPVRRTSHCRSRDQRASQIGASRSSSSESVPVPSARR